MHGKWNWSAWCGLLTGHRVVMTGPSVHMAPFSAYEFTIFQVGNPIRCMETAVAQSAYNICWAI